MNDITKQVNINNVFGPVNIENNTEYKIGSIVNSLLNLLVKNENLHINNFTKPPAKTIKKIKYNNLEKRKYVIVVYQKHSKIIEEAFNNLNSLIPFGKEKVLNSLNNMYYEALDIFEIDYLDDDYLPLVQIKSIEIIDFILYKMKCKIIESDCSDFFSEDIDLGTQLIVAYAFIECQIMENPNDS